MSRDSKVKVPFFERHGWKVLTGVSAIFLLFGLGDIILGIDADPAIAESITGVGWETLQASDPSVANMLDLAARSTGLGIVFLSILSIAVIFFAFRQGKQWAWFVLWIWPFWMGLIFILFFTAERQPGFQPPPPMVSAPFFFAVTVLTLVLTRRKFFVGRDAPALEPAMTGRDA
jgi:hypothetical protein